MEDRPRRDIAMFRYGLIREAADPELCSTERGRLVRHLASPPETFGRFEAATVNDLWVGDVAHGPRVGGRRALLFAFLHDHSHA